MAGQLAQLHASRVGLPAGVRVAWPALATRATRTATATATAVQQSACSTALGSYLHWHVQLPTTVLPLSLRLAAAAECECVFSVMMRMTMAMTTSTKAGRDASAAVTAAASLHRGVRLTLALVVAATRFSCHCHSCSEVAATVSAAAHLQLLLCRQDYLLQVLACSCGALLAAALAALGRQCMIFTKAVGMCMHGQRPTAPARTARMAALRRPAAPAAAVALVPGQQQAVAAAAGRHQQSRLPGCGAPQPWCRLHPLRLFLLPVSPVRLFQVLLPLAVAQAGLGSPRSLKLSRLLQPLAVLPATRSPLRLALALRTRSLQPPLALPVTAQQLRLPSRSQAAAALYGLLCLRLRVICLRPRSHWQGRSPLSLPEGTVTVLHLPVLEAQRLAL